jgi:hypothetical protein
MKNSNASAISINKDKYTLRGRVINGAEKPAPGLTVHAVDRDLIGKHDHLGTAVTGPEGEFTIDFKISDFAELLSDRQPDLYFRVYQNNKVILDTEFDFIPNADDRTPPITLQVELETVETNEPDTVSPDEKPAETITIRKIPKVAQYKGASWKNEVKRAEKITLQEAEQIAMNDPKISYFVYVNSPMFLEGKEGPNGYEAKGQFKRRDVVFFSGKPVYASAPQADLYVKQRIVWKKKTNVAQYKGAAWDNEYMRLSGLTLDRAKAIAANASQVSYFFMTRSTLWLEGKEGPGGWTDKGHFHKNDVVFFTGKPWYGSAPQADAYEKTEAPYWEQ